MRSLVTVHPDYGFGSACIRDTGISTAVVYGRWLSGETYEELATDYRVDTEYIMCAVHYELGRLERHQGKAWREATRRDA